jgi:hypothetical protein
MTQVEEMVLWFDRRGGKATLRDILQSGERWMHKCTARISDARKQGYRIECVRGQRPSDNLYMIQPPAKEEANGQRLFT